MDQEKLETILGRKEHSDLIKEADKYVEFYVDERILITGGNGTLGSALVNWFHKRGIVDVLKTDIVEGYDPYDIDFTHYNVLYDPPYFVEDFEPTIIFHCVAPESSSWNETSVTATYNVNVEGVIQVHEHFPDSRLVLASSSKAVEPETVYGASKLMAERYVLENGGIVARHFNFAQSYGNVFDIWDHSNGSYLVSECYNYYTSIDEAVALMLFAGMQDSGRYIVEPEIRRNMIELCNLIFGNDYVVVPRRRGDRVVDSLIGHAENIVNTKLRKIYKVEGYHD